ncbi:MULTISPECIES: cytochrome C oxidase subunit IV family protein [Paenibacillus]|uniref:Cytochrome c oxidase subunit 4 n=1 Tax=Paenibacillus favisporus TaxID=221028 RepID=A0ABV2F6X2_9BACL|nr:MULTISPECIES: cytochrome C oxidase subunit IV family protein [Paenibacillus]RED34595.1 cytochrome c oxidase subunit 4 [Paenibacillus sp. VMFN-D1]UYO06150.1 cytochrome C oxidase subunit IV family protein [Paenibacillus sp. PSB04]
MTTVEQHQDDTVKHGHRHEGPQKHVIVFIFSIILTAIAFASVMAGGVNVAFTVILLVVMAVLQALVQLGYWMHLKDKGHLMPIIFMCGGGFVAFTAIVTALYWVWW